MILVKTVKQFNLVKCQGTAYEIGQQWGEGCRENILQSIENTFNIMAFVYQSAREDVIAKAMQFYPMVQDFDPYLIDIMRGQADATGVSLEQIFTQKCVFELMFYYTGTIPGLCTSFAATGKATQDGKTLLGQNIDWSPEATIDLLKIHHTGGPVQYVLSFSDSSEYTLSSSGFGLCANATIGRSYSFNLPVACYLPRIMRQKNIHDAMSLLKQVARGLGYYHLADAQGQMLGIESIHNDFEVISPEKDLLLHSNHYITERFKKDDTASFIQPDSYHRLESITKLAHQHYGRLSPEIAMEILSDHEHHPKSICRHDTSSTMPSVTHASFIMVPEEGAIYIAAGNPCEYQYERYSF